MRRFFFFGSPAPNPGEGNGQPINDNSTSRHKKTDEGKDSSGSCSTRLSRSRSRRQKRHKEEPANPKQLRRSMSFSSPARNSCVDERCFSFSGDVPCSLYDESDAPHHAKDVVSEMCSPEGNPCLREYAIKTPRDHSAMDDSPHSRCCSCSAGHSPVSSPVAIQCRSTRLSNLSNKNEVLDRYIDRGHEDAIINDKQKQCAPVISMVSNLGRPPRPQSTVPSIPKSMKDTTESYSDVDLKDAFLWRLAQEGTGDTHKIKTMCSAVRRHISTPDASERESSTSVEDIYEDLQDVRLPNIVCPSTCPTSVEDETDDILLQRAIEVESRFIIPCGDEYEFSMLRDKNDLFQLIQQLTEDRKQLAHELSSEIKARVTERFAAKDQYKQAKKELDNKNRRLENEKRDVQTTLEREMDRRSEDWSIRLSKFQSEEERLRERVRELAEQNVSFQREVTFLEANKAEASRKVASLEMQNSKLNDDLEKLRNEHEKLHSSSVDLQARFAEVVEGRDHIQEYLKAKEGENKALHKVIARLQTTCNEQERTITGLRQGCIDELDRKFVECTSSEKIKKLQKELIRLTGVEQKLRGETRSSNLEVESLRQENIALLNRLQSAGNGASFSSIRLDQELQVLKKDESINEIQQDFQESAKELAALRGTLKTVTEERDMSRKGRSRYWRKASTSRSTSSAAQGR